jgi:hypothetical protein
MTNSQKHYSEQKKKDIEKIAYNDLIHINLNVGSIML